MEEIQGGLEMGQKVKSLDLPDRICLHCGKKISYWNWALTQGYCEECVRKLAEEMERDEVY